MNYAQYLQNGGSAEPRQFSEEEIAMIKTLQPYGEAFKQSPGGAIEMAARELNFNLDSPAEIREFLTGLDAYARLIDDVDLINDIQKFGQESNLVAEEPIFKCGGRVRAKVKKACGGKKLEKGAKVPVEKKGGCPCQYRRVGGRIQLVDCNGIPVAKNGAVLKAQRGNEIPENETSKFVKSYMSAKPITNAIPLSDQWFGDLGNAFINKMNNWQTGLQQKNPYFWGSSSAIEQPVSGPAVGSDEWKAQQIANQEAYNQSPEGQAAIAKVEKSNQNVAKTPAQTARTLTGRGLFTDNGFSNLQSFAARKAWLQDPANAEYVKALGFDVNSYKGTIAQNQALLGMLQAKQMLDEDRREQMAELAAMKAQNVSLSKLTPVQQGLATTVVTPNAMSARSPLNLSLKKSVVFSKSGGTFPYADYLK